MSRRTWGLLTARIVLFLNLVVVTWIYSIHTAKINSAKHSWFVCVIFQ